MALDSLRHHSDIKHADNLQKRLPFGIGRRIFGPLGFLIIILGITLGASAQRAELPGRWQWYQEIKNGTYLLLFENNAELRPAGGFLGTFAQITLKDGQLTSVYVDTNIYKRDTAFIQTAQVEPPEPIKRTNHTLRWSMRDSNWAADFADAAQHVEWFYAREGGQSVDGVIAVTASAFEELLKITGPIDLPGYGFSLTADNFFPEIQYRVEKGYFTSEENKAANEPKTILKDALPVVVERIYKSNPIALYKLFGRMANQKQLVFWFKNPTAQNLVEQWNWAGRVRVGPGNTFSTVNAALDQAKSSRSVHQNVELTEETIGTAKRVEATITRTHLGTKTWPDGDDQNYFQLIIPKDARLESVTVNGREILGKPYILERTPFGYPINQQVTIQTLYQAQLVGFWLDTRAGGSSVAELKYTVTGTTGPTLIQKQIGATNESIRLIRNGSVRYNGPLTQDLLI